MKVLVTGSQGFLGKNFIVHVNELKKHEVLEFSRESSEGSLTELVLAADIIFHFAGINRPQEPGEFKTGNFGFSDKIAQILKEKKKATPVVFSSSIQAGRDNDYGKSKVQAEETLKSLAPAHPVYVYRLPNIFGKWSKPNYNSAVATFCYNLINNKPIEIHDPGAKVNLVYVDDVCAEFVSLLEGYANNPNYIHPRTKVETEYFITVGELAATLKEIKESRQSMITGPVGTGLYRALNSTFLSFLKPEGFSYSLTRHADPRGVFVEFLKTKDSGQFSFFTAGIGITRGGHYHHTKTEKFLVLQGEALYSFRHLLTNETFSMTVKAEESKVVETIPGWSHDIKNVGNQELIVMLWANEIFDRQKPDTVAWKVL